MPCCAVLCAEVDKVSQWGVVEELEESEEEESEEEEEEEEPGGGALNEEDGPAPSGPC